MVKDFVIDPMHIFGVGIVKRLFVYMFSKKEDQANFIKIGQRYGSQRYTAEFHRQPRSFAEFKHFKATERRALMLYGLEIYVKDIVSPDAYKLIVALCTAYRILADRRLVHHEYWLDASRRLFDTFVRRGRILFGSNFISLNVHLFSHITDDAERFGAIEDNSCFKFENTLKMLKGLCKYGFKNPIVTLSNRIGSNYVVRSNIANKELTKLDEKLTTRATKTGVLKKCIWRHILYTNKPPNCYIGSDNSVYKITDITISDGVLMMSCQQYGCVTIAWKIFNVDPPVRLNSGKLGIFKVAGLKKETCTLPVTAIEEKYVLISIDGDKGGQYVYPLLPLEKSINTRTDD